MKITETLLSMAKKLESENNEALIASEDFGFSVMGRVAIACADAARVLKDCAYELEKTQNKPHLFINEAKIMLKILSAALEDNTIRLELFNGEEKFAEILAPAEEAIAKLNLVELPKDITTTVAFADPQTLFSTCVSKMGALADVLDGATDPSLNKQASVIDELLLTISAPENYADNFKAAQTKKLDELRQLYQRPNEELHKVIGVEDAKKAIEKSEYAKAVRPLETPLSTRYCPNHAGAPMARIGNAEWQCSLDHKVFNYEAGFTDDKGKKHPPAGAPAIAEMTKRPMEYHSLFSTREEHLNKMK